MVSNVDAAFEEFKKLKDLGMTMDSVTNLFTSLDVNRNGIVDYSEFIASCIINRLHNFEAYLQEIMSSIDNVGCHS